jgi:predicted nicotinamide N-methyase
MDRRVSLADPTAFIRANLPLVPVPGIPEIVLHKASPSSGLATLAAQDPDFASPYWAYHWAGGLALARFVLDHAERVAGRRVLDLGTGAGLVAIAAAMAGAAQVIGADVDRYALAALRLNAAHNGVAVGVMEGDLTLGESPPVDLILVGDLFYAPDLAERVIAFLDRCLADGMEVLIGDPWRAPLPTARVTLLAEYKVAETGHAATKASAVFSLRPK